MQDSQKGSGAAVGIVAAIIGLVAGMLISSAYKGKQYEDKMVAMQKQNDAAMQQKPAAVVVPPPTAATKAADLRVLLNVLMRQHVNLASTAVRGAFNDSKDFAAVAASLDENSVAISKAIGSVYGKDAEEKWLLSWRAHIGFFVDYTKAAKKGDKKAMDTAVENLTAYVDGVADFLSKANPNLPKTVVAQVVGEHVKLLKGAVDAYGAGDVAKSYEQQTKADAQIGTIGDAIAGAIVKQYPEKF